MSFLHLKLQCQAEDNMKYTPFLSYFYHFLSQLPASIPIRFPLWLEWLQMEFPFLFLNFHILQGESDLLYFARVPCVLLLQYQALIPRRLLRYSHTFFLCILRRAALHCLEKNLLEYPYQYIAVGFLLPLRHAAQF